jgi:hypothetical protein
MRLWVGYRERQGVGDDVAVSLVVLVNLHKDWLIFQ